jgi:hypothetical protein
MEGEDLGELLRKPSDNDEDLLLLNPVINDAKVYFVYKQIAGFQLELSRMEFPRIGAISVDSETGEGRVSGPPLPYWKCLHREGRGASMLEQAILDDKSEFPKRKKAQFDAYWAEKQRDKRLESS